MKKLTIILAIIIVVLSLNKQEKVVIPKETIRFRVIANSNKVEDQALKKQVVNSLNENIKKLTFTTKDISSSREIIKSSLPTFESTIQKTLKEENSTQSYTLNYGMNYFPEKEYKGVIYEEGEYESLVITLGDGSGDNFWCILFPPLCLLEADEENLEEVEYTSFIKEVIEKYF